MASSVILFAASAALTPALAKSDKDRTAGQEFALGGNGPAPPSRAGTLTELSGKRLPTANEHLLELDEISRRMNDARRRWLEKASPEFYGKATVLLVMKPGNRGIRRISKTADPILCTALGCYISRGIDQTAQRMSRQKALGIANTFGRRAGACSNRTHCVFRNVDLNGLEALIEPVDLRVVRHDRRPARSVTIDHTCNVIASRLYCTGGLRTADYTAWIVPEKLASRLDGTALLHALWHDLAKPARSALAPSR